MIKIRGKWRVVAGVGVAYMLTWTHGIPSARDAIANGVWNNVSSLLDFEPAAEAAAYRAKLWDRCEREHTPIEAKSRIDVLYEWTVPVLPSLIVSSYRPYVDGQGMACVELSSLVLWFGFGSTVILTATANGLDWGPPG
jgi:hypothetical protein